MWAIFNICVTTWSSRESQQMLYLADGLHAWSESFAQFTSARVRLSFSNCIPNHRAAGPNKVTSQLQRRFSDLALAGVNFGLWIHLCCRQNPARWRHLSRQDVAQTLVTDVPWCLPTSEGTIFQVSDTSGFSRARSDTGTLLSSGIFGMSFPGHGAAVPHPLLFLLTLSLTISHSQISHFHIFSPTLFLHSLLLCLSGIYVCLSLWHFKLTNKNEY